MFRSFVLITACLLTPLLHGQQITPQSPFVPIGPAFAPPAISFATIDQGRKLLTPRDEFVARLSPFDRAARMKTDKDVSEGEYLAFVASNVLEWSPEEKSAVEAAWSGLLPKMAELHVPLPRTILFVKTTGAEEGNAEYTRGTGIVLPGSALAPSKRENLPALIAHETFHVLSRNAPQLRERLYSIIGFQPCGEIPFPPGLASRRITNPDAPLNDHCIFVKYGLGAVWVVPLLYSKSPRYDVAKGGPFFDYLQLNFLVLDKIPALVSAPYNTESPILLDIKEIDGFYDKVGRNTEYIIHPDEILADNFRLLLLGKTDVASPEILRNLARALAQP